jgi:hypothetical protein
MKPRWNILYRDIMKINVIIFDKETQVNLTQEELDEIIDRRREEDQDNIYFIMKILYHEHDDNASQDNDNE